MHGNDNIGGLLNSKDTEVEFPILNQPPEVFYKKAILKFCNIHRKTPALESIFNKVAGLACNFIKKRLQQSTCFLMNIAKFLKIPIWKNICQRLLLLITLERNEYWRGRWYSNTCSYIYVTDVFLSPSKKSMVELLAKIVNV